MTILICRSREGGLKFLRCQADFLIISQCQKCTPFDIIVLNMNDEGREITPPKGYWEDKRDGRPILASEDVKDVIALTNRPLYEVDAYFDNLLTTGISSKIKEMHGRRVEILDLGSGTQSLACKEIGEEFGDNVRIYGIDFYPKDAEETSVVQGDIRKLPFKTGNFDIIFSTEVLNYLKHNEDEQVVDEINRFLNQEGLLFYIGIIYLFWMDAYSLISASKQKGFIWLGRVKFLRAMT